LAGDKQSKVTSKSYKQ